MESREQVPVVDLGRAARQRLQKEPTTAPDGTWAVRERAME